MGPTPAAQSTGPTVRDASTVGGLTTQFVSLSGAEIDALAADPAVVAITPYSTPRLLDERSAQIVAGNLSGGQPSGPGYLAWLGSKGFGTPTPNFAIDVTDEGLDDGSAVYARPRRLLRERHAPDRPGGVRARLDERRLGPRLRRAWHQCRLDRGGLRGREFPCRSGRPGIQVRHGGGASRPDRGVEDLQLRRRLRARRSGRVPRARGRRVRGSAPSSRTTRGATRTLVSTAQTRASSTSSCVTRSRRSRATRRWSR